LGIFLKAGLSHAAIFKSYKKTLEFLGMEQVVCQLHFGNLEILEIYLNLKIFFDNSKYKLT